MTRYSDNIFSGYDAITSALSSRSPVALVKTYSFNATTGSSTQSGVFPPGTQNLTAALYITQQGSATSSDKITVSAGGTTLITLDQFGSASGIAVGNSQTAIARITYVASACQAIPVPSGANNGGEIPYSVTYLKSSANKTGSCSISLNFNRIDP